MFFAYTGYARLTILGEEVRDPARTIPRAIVLALGLAMLLYAAVAVAAVGVIGADGMSEKLADAPAPLHRAAAALPKPWVGVAIAVGATTAMLGVLLSQLLGISRMLFAMARGRDLPAALATSPRPPGCPTAASSSPAWSPRCWRASARCGPSRRRRRSRSCSTRPHQPGRGALAAADRLYPRAFAWLGLATSLALAAALPWRTIGLGLALLAGGLVRGWLFGGSADNTRTGTARRKGGRPGISVCPAPRAFRWPP